MIRAVVVDAGKDLRPLLAALARQGVRFRVNEESGTQVIWVQSDNDALQVKTLFEQWQQLDASGMLPQTEGVSKGALSGYFPMGHYTADMWRACLQAPVTALLILVTMIVAVVSQVGTNLNPVAFLFYPALQPVGGTDVSSLLTMLGDISGPAEFLRTLAPALLHFGVMHLVFNTLWLWYFGRMIEENQSSIGYFLLLLFTAFVSNTTQYVSSMTSNFGGLSGVVYGLLGYIWMWQVILPKSRLRLPASMIAILLVALVLMEVFASSWIASAAHAGGLIAGMIAGVFAALVVRLRHPS